MTCPVKFRVEATVGDARAAELTLARGTVKTPIFMPVGTQGAIRTLSPMHLADTGAQIILANTYHLHQRPGEDLVARHGGLHGMMNVDLPILTDSGGFQVFSLDKKSVDEQGVTFGYEVDGKATFLSPEVSMDIQMKLGADIAMVFDECLAFGTDKSYAERSVARTTRWERRSKEAHTRPDQSLFGIVQGGFWPDLRKRSAEEIREIGFDGYAIGGLSVGEGHEKMCEVLDYTTEHMSPEHPRYLMGVGRPLDLVEGVARGIDMFDCVIQTRHARSGMFYTTRGRMRVTDSRFRRDMYPPDSSCSCYTCRNFTRAYLHHLFKVGEVLGATLATVHNITWFCDFMTRMRASIVDGTFEAFRKGVHEAYPEKPRQPPKSKGKRGKKRR
ncbi:MAG: tRNA guanosine(34) transglycosylase Tgt [Proteobacteria bacterium]|nr:tRNA guanosine(34) transglycosylase Tgt [Pseudomonadota bacterium]MCP4915676.1 tRNA guanosine(34) transglycosylase Tgt [Pseudomonadota bacterium]